MEKAIQYAPNLAQAHRDLGKAYFQKNELEKAVKEYRKVAELDPEEDTVHYRLSQIYRKLGQREEAEAELRIFETLAKKVKAQNPLLPGLSNPTEGEQESAAPPISPSSDTVQSVH